MIDSIKKFKENDYIIDSKELLDILLIIYVFCGHICNHTIVFKFFSILFAFGQLVYISRKKKLYISSYIVFYSFFIIFCILQVKLGISINEGQSNSMIKTLIIDIILNFFVINYLFFEDNLVKFIKIYSSTAFVYCLYMLATNITRLGSARLGNDQYIPFSNHSAMYQSNGVGFIFAYAFVMYMYRILMDKEKKCIVYASICAIAGFLTGSRKALLIIVIGCFMMLLIFYQGKNKVKILVISVITVAIMAVLVMKVPAFYNTVGSRFEALIEGTKSGKMKEASADTRDRLIKFAKRLYSMKKQTGWGLDCFRLFKNSYGLYAHNNFWELLADTGYIGFSIFYISYVIGLVYLLIGFIKKDNMARLGLICFGMYVVMEYGIVSYYDRPFHIILMFSN